MRLRNKPWAQDKIEEHPGIVVINPEEWKGKWAEQFNNNNPIHIEVGTGKGQFITEMSKLHPNVNYIGIERQKSIVVSAIDKIKESGQKNVRMINVNAVELNQYFAENEVHRVYLNFSDPWPKNRHEKRRLSHDSFLESYENVLIPNGEIHMKTDNQGLFEYSLHSFSKYGMVLNNVSLDLHKSGIEGNIMTEYEEKFSEKGNRIYRCEAVYRNG
ncbi:tRNA (guanosine(46)-N7)-methyltransferase TrmB [Pseudalkalibacillus berkeleyi]|uniref:tRNA (guanine-N(7)-)-methyltransferase n=1 Tax=Pseudalkalibacillus berkeleyi TaxID=1069813 RepID=A0ABS9H2N4_9BACL|nr:tRNA (guanosine(46)-N7)-methyltransferase TrmB [Pseudalkalibacillus berkeleyi]MCF6138326.1 tRNA (guanosine(46)-N7)-methyltransferase TrmB [Pseudalkalibacillus berkeleyi]